MTSGRRDTSPLQIQSVSAFRTGPGFVFKAFISEEKTQVSEYPDCAEDTVAELSLHGSHGVFNSTPCSENPISSVRHCTEEILTTMAEVAPAPAAAPAKAAKKKAVKKAKTGPSVRDLITKTVAASKERNGVSLAALKKALAAAGYDVEKNKGRIKVAVKSMVASGVLTQTKGTGASGSFKMSKKAEAKPKKKAVKKAAPKAKKAAAKKPATPKRPKKPAAAKKAPKKSPKKAAKKAPAAKKAAAKSPKKAPKKVIKKPAAKKAPAKKAAAKPKAKKAAAKKK
ncbi:histone H1-like [Sphaeramia orbicularis]|uniref:histone H1-like n=1 Tax=Sphaeramia orbicularis TaxID=375764 RepID=UPI001180BDB9|nr:histone H1-like [Sphaeramia orbicularis]